MSVPVLGVRRGILLKVNKFEQVSSLGNQMSGPEGLGGPQMHKYENVSSFVNQMQLTWGRARVGPVQ